LFISTEAEIQTLNFYNEGVKFAHNEMSDWTPAARGRRNGLNLNAKKKTDSLERRINIAF